MINTVYNVKYIVVSITQAVKEDEHIGVDLIL